MSNKKRLQWLGCCLIASGLLIVCDVKGWRYFVLYFAQLAFYFLGEAEAERKQQ